MNSTFFFWAAALVAAIYYFRKTVTETAQTIIGDINSTTTIAPDPDDTVANALLDPKVVSAQYGNDGEIVFVLDDGSVIRRKSEKTPFTTEGTIAAPPLVFGYNQKP